jgi:hypothetical protein
MSADNGGPAFPTTEGNGVNYGDYGMTLRDYFAAKAMQGLIAGCERPFVEHIAKMSYDMADAMIKARSA